MTRHTTFQYTADPTAGQERALLRHVGAARFAFNQGLRMHVEARVRRRRDDGVRVPWSGFDLIKAFNAWKVSERAGRVIVVDGRGTASLDVTGLSWRHEVSAQVFEEAMIDLGRSLQAWVRSRSGKRHGGRVEHPRFKRKDAGHGSFRMRNKSSPSRNGSIRIGEGHPRSVTLPGIGVVRVRDDTRRLRRMLASGRARVLSATVTRRGGRWRLSINVRATDLHPQRRHPARDASGGWVGVDRGLRALVVAATSVSEGGVEVLRVERPRTTDDEWARVRRLHKAVTRKQRGSGNRRRAVARLARCHARIRDARQHRLHQISGALVKTHDRLVLEDLHVRGLMANHHLARAIGEAGWAVLARQISYKAAWLGGTVVVADRWYPSSKTCSMCGTVKPMLSLGDRVFACGGCGNTLDRDLNAAINLATWGETRSAQAPDPEARGRVTNARRRDRSGRGPNLGETIAEEAGTRTRRTSL